MITLSMIPLRSSQCITYLKKLYTSLMRYIKAVFYFMDIGNCWIQMSDVEVNYGRTMQRNVVAADHFFTWQLPYSTTMRCQLQILSSKTIFRIMFNRFLPSFKIIHLPNNKHHFTYTNLIWAEFPIQILINQVNKT